MMSAFRALSCTRAARPLTARSGIVAFPTFGSPRALDLGEFYGSVRDGKVELFGLARGKVLIFSHDEDVAANPVVVDTSNGSVSGVEIRFSPGTLVTLDACLEPPLRAIATIRDDAEIPVWSQQVPQWRRSLQLVPGAYVLTLVQDDGEEAVIPFVVGSEPVHLRFDDLGLLSDQPETVHTLAGLAAATRESLSGASEVASTAEPNPFVLLQGKVVGPEGQDVRWAQISLTDGDGVAHSTRCQGYSGYFALSGLSPGSYRAQVRVQGHQTDDS